MKVLSIANRNMSVFRPGIISAIDSPATTITKQGVISQSIKDLLTKFRHIPEIGRFDKIRVDLPIHDSILAKASMIIEPSAKRNDFRTRVLSFVAYKPDNDKVIRSVAHAIGNNTAIESVLKDSSTVTAFKRFIAESERFFEANY